LGGEQQQLDLLGLHPLPLRLAPAQKLHPTGSRGAERPVVPMSNSGSGGPSGVAEVLPGLGGVRRVHRDECGHHLLHYLCPSGDEDNWDHGAVMYLACCTHERIPYIYSEPDIILNFTMSNCRLYRKHSQRCLTFDIRDIYSRRNRLVSRPVSKSVEILFRRYRILMVTQFRKLYLRLARHRRAALEFYCFA
jgi:hypothetical protein